MGTVRNDDAGTLVVTPGHVVLSDDHEACELAVGSCKRIEGEFRHSGNRGQGLCKMIIYPERALHRRLRLERVKAGESGMCRDLFIYLRVVLHGTASERIESGIHTEVHLREIRIMSYHIQLAYLRQGRFVRTKQACRQVRKG